MLRMSGGRGEWSKGRPRPEWRRTKGTPGIPGKVWRSDASPSGRRTAWEPASAGNPDGRGRRGSCQLGESGWGHLAKSSTPTAPQSPGRVLGLLGALWGICAACPQLIFECKNQVRCWVFVELFPKARYREELLCYLPFTVRVFLRCYFPAMSYFDTFSSLSIWNPTNRLSNLELRFAVDGFLFVACWCNIMKLL